MAHAAREAQQHLPRDQLSDFPEEALSRGDPTEAELGAVFAFALRMLRDRDDAEDATQETFLRAHRSASAFRGESERKTWLLSIARNVCLDRLRGRKRQSLTAMSRLVDEARDEKAEDAPSALERESYIGAVREGCLLGTLASLSPDQRAAFALNVLAGMGAAESAAVLGKSANALRILTHRATARLKTFLCRHCSLYDKRNPCSCEALVGFSLARRWIGPEDRTLRSAEASAIAEKAAAALDEVGRLAAVYSALPERKPKEDAVSRLRDALRSIAGT